jgi:hypothetical protein
VGAPPASGAEALPFFFASAMTKTAATVGGSSSRCLSLLMRMGLRGTERLRRRHNFASELEAPLLRFLFFALFPFSISIYG